MDVTPGHDQTNIQALSKRAGIDPALFSAMGHNTEPAEIVFEVEATGKRSLARDATLLQVTGEPRTNRWVTSCPKHQAAPQMAFSNRPAPGL